MAHSLELKHYSEEDIHKLFAAKVPKVLEKYRLSKFLGKGHSSKVVKGTLIGSKRGKKEVAIKLLGSKTSFTSIMDEIHILKELKGSKNIVKYIEHFHNGEYTALVTSYLKSPALKDVYLNFTPSDMQCYMKNLLVGLEQVHSQGFFHGDIKAGNFLFSENLDEFLLIDFGMSQRLNTQLRQRGTRGYKAPEVLLKYSFGSSTVDIWSAGVVFAILLSGIYPFFVEKSENSFKEFCIIFGAEALLEAASQLNRTEFVKNVIKGMELQTPLDLKKLCFYFRKYDLIVNKDDSGEKCFNCKQLAAFCLCRYANGSEQSIAETLDIFPASTFDLLERMLTLNPSKRITSEEALVHPFFQENLDSFETYLDSSSRNFDKGIINALSLQFDESESTDTDSESSTSSTSS